MYPPRIPLLVNTADIVALRAATRDALADATARLIRADESFDLADHTLARDPNTAELTPDSQTIRYEHQHAMHVAVIARQRCLNRIIELSCRLTDFEADFSELVTAAKKHQFRPELSGFAIVVPTAAAAIRARA